MYSDRGHLTVCCVPEGNKSFQRSEGTVRRYWPNLSLRPDDTFHCKRHDTKENTYTLELDRLQLEFHHAVWLSQRTAFMVAPSS